MITVGIPTYNRSSYLKDALNSLIEQTNKNFKVIVADNASTDSTKDILNEFADLLDITYIVNPENIGMTGNWNVIIENADTEYLKFLMDDDLLYNDCIQSFYDCINQTENVVLFATLGNIFHTENPLRSIVPIYVPEIEINGFEMLKYLNLWTNQIGCPTNVMVKLDVFKKNVDLWKSKDNFWTIDILAFAKLLKYGNFYCINKSLVGIRIHENSMTNQLMLKNMMNEEIFLINSISNFSRNNFNSNRIANIHVSRLLYIKIIETVKTKNFALFKYFLKMLIKQPQPLKGIYMYYNHSFNLNFKNKINKLIDILFKRQRIVYRFTAMEKYWKKYNIK